MSVKALYSQCRLNPRVDSRRLVLILVVTADVAYYYLCTCCRRLCAVRVSFVHLIYNPKVFEGKT